MWSRAALLLLTLLAFALRLHALDAVPLRWDEGWSIALAVLPGAETLRLTALDVHPPLYYLLLRPWLALGTGPVFWPRLASVFAATVAVPLSAAAAAAWWRRSAPAAPVAVAAYVALAPAFVYYAGVTRMYALTTPFLFLAAMGVARCATRRDGVLPAALGAAAALYTFYYTAFALAGLFAAALLAWPRAWRRLAAAGLLAALAFAPWLTYAGRQVTTRVGQRTDLAGALDPRAVLALLDDGLFAAVFAYRAGWAAVLVAAAVLLAAVLVARPLPWRRLSVVVLPTLATLVGAAVGSQAHMFAPRYTIVATPFLALGLGWAVAVLWAARKPAGLLAAAALLAAAWPTLSGYVYSRAAEVSDAYDPTEPARILAERAHPADIAAFNILSLAGAYELYRSPDAPPWTYAQVWDPVREDTDLALRRVAADAEGHPRLWLVLYRGTASPGSAALKEWADAELFPSSGQWTADTLYQGYVAADLTERAVPNAAFAAGPALVSAAYTGRAEPGTGIGVELLWRADGPVEGDGRVFVHAYDAAGALVAQHDGYPVADSRPPATWATDERIRDRHGLSLPPGFTGRLTLVAGLYDPATGDRWPTTEGADSVPIGTVEVLPAEGTGTQ